MRCSSSRSVALAAPPDGIEEPDALRRVDGSSVYTVAGADLYTSQRILDAEQRLVAVDLVHNTTSTARLPVWPEGYARASAASDHRSPPPPESLRPSAPRP